MGILDTAKPRCSMCGSNVASGQYSFAYQCCNSCLAAKQKIPGLRIRCAICDKPVDRIVVLHDDWNKTTRIIAHCHGDRDEMSLDPARFTPEQLRDMNNMEGVAFTTQRIEETPNE